MLSLRRQDRENRTVPGLHVRHHRQRIFLNWAGSRDVYGAKVALILAALIVGASKQLLFVVYRTNEYPVALVGNDSSMAAFLLLIPG